MIHVACHPVRVLSIPIKRNPRINIMFALNFFTKNILLHLLHPSSSSSFFAGVGG
jgi:hypothetical protein